MGLILSIKEMNNIPPLEDGTYTGTLIGIVEMGEQLGFEKKRYRPTIQFTFEVYGEFIDRGNGDEPRWAYAELTRSLGKNSNLLAALEALQGRPLTEEELEHCDLTAYLGKSCTIEIKSSASGFANVRKITKRMKGIDPGKPVSDTFLFDMDAEDRDERIQDLSPWVRKKIELSPTWARLHAGSEEMDLDEDDAPNEGGAPSRGAAPAPIPSDVDPETGEILRPEDIPF